MGERKQAMQRRRERQKDDVPVTLDGEADLVEQTMRQ